MLKILLIEDEFIIAKDIQILLKNDNYAEVDLAKNYDAACTPDFFIFNDSKIISKCFISEK